MGKVFKQQRNRLKKIEEKKKFEEMIMGLDDDKSYQISQGGKKLFYGNFLSGRNWKMYLLGFYGS